MYYRNGSINLPNRKSMNWFSPFRAPGLDMTKPSAFSAPPLTLHQEVRVQRSTGKLHKLSHKQTRLEAVCQNNSSWKPKQSTRKKQR